MPHATFEYFTNKHQNYTLILRYGYTFSKYVGYQDFGSRIKSINSTTQDVKGVTS